MHLLPPQAVYVGAKRGAKRGAESGPALEMVSSKLKEQRLASEIEEYIEEELIRLSDEEDI